jgi:hypothetical protein
MSDFSPGLAAQPTATRAEYDTGPQGHVQSLETMRQKMREGRIDPRILGWTGEVLRARGLDGRGVQPTSRAMVQAILDAYRAQTIYAPDPAGTEYIQGAAATLCLQPGLCLRRGDCDDGCVAVGSATLSLAIPTQIVKEDYGAGIQSHVLLAFKDERGLMFYADPSTKDPITSTSRAAQQTFYDPMSDAPIEIVGVGRPGYGSLGATPATTPTPAQVQSNIIGNWVDVPSNTVQAGLRYAVGIVAPATWTQDDVKVYFSGEPAAQLGLMAIANPTAAGSFLVDTVQPGSVVGGYTSWIMTGLARKDAVLSSTADVSIAAVLQEVGPPAAQAGPAPTPLALAVPPPPPQPTIGLGAVLVGGLGLAAVGGIAWGMYRKRGKR